MSFSGQIGKFRAKAERAIILTAKDSAKEVSDIANTPQALGGRLPVDTGALRASIRAAIGTMPDRSSYEVTAGIGRWKMGETLFIGWTQFYGIYQEHNFGFMRLAAQKWPQIVAKNAAKRSK